MQGRKLTNDERTQINHQFLRTPRFSCSVPDTRAHCSKLKLRARICQPLIKEFNNTTHTQTCDYCRNLRHRKVLFFSLIYTGFARSNPIGSDNGDAEQTMMSHIALIAPLLPPKPKRLTSECTAAAAAATKKMRPTFDVAQCTSSTSSSHCRSI